jgi:DNA polymerase (family 10)
MRVIQKAAETGTALEINVQPKRMDLDDYWARMAHEEGVMLAIGTDSHDLMSFKYIKMGVGIARRAWCEAAHILNTRSWKEVTSFIQKKQSTAKVNQ